ncbi:hypothetical protein HII36_51405 [Nonomuraea sp. NN258]|uniref:hypothetical protein n=1 Tax=Nonomuraea antri TaxID=2730852 RepID=UPI001568B8FF|nr:hypothetical protein [Nonomuraea antri]NRQ40177.1 hypothetical protein [Nonomuraea antri]
MNHDTVPALDEVPWPDQSPQDLEVLALCCPQCGNNELVETSILTNQGYEDAFECDHCGEVCLDAR